MDPGNTDSVAVGSSNITVQSIQHMEWNA